MSQLKTNNKTKIISWSGGPDSTACLIDLLQYTDDPVIAYHIFVKPTNASVVTGNYNLDQPGEKLDYQAVKKLTPMLKEQFRDFDVRFITITTPQDPDNYHEIGLYPLLIAINNDAIYYSGRCAEDTEDDQSWVTNTSTPLYHFVERRDAIKDFCDLEIVKYNSEKTKKQIRKELGEKIWKLTWSCQLPTSTNKPCGKCPKCVINKSTSTRKKKKSSKGTQ